MSQVKELYYGVIDDVINKSKDVFGDVDPQTFDQLRELWTHNVMKSKVMSNEITESQEYELPMQAHHPSAASLPQQARRNPKPGMGVPNRLPNPIPAFTGGTSQPYPNYIQGFQNLHGLGMPGLPYPVHNFHQNPQSQQQYSVPKFPGGRDINNNNSVPQNDGPSDEQEKADKSMQEEIGNSKPVYSLEIDLRKVKNFPQFDGNGDDDDDDDDEEEGDGEEGGEEEGGEEEGAEGDGEGEEEGGDEGEGEGEGEGDEAQAQDDQLESDLDEDEEDDSDIKDLVLCIYDKVSRVKHKWKCQLSNGIMKIAEKDYLFSKGTGDFEWS